MTAEQKDKVASLRSRLAHRRDVALSNYEFCADMATKANKNAVAAQGEFEDLSILVNATDGILLRIAEVTR